MRSNFFGAIEVALYMDYLRGVSLIIDTMDAFFFNQERPLSNFVFVQAIANYKFSLVNSYLRIKLRNLQLARKK